MKRQPSPVGQAREFPGDAQYVVTVPLAVVRCGPDGHYEHHYSGARLPASVDPAQIEHLLASGQIKRIERG